MREQQRESLKEVSKKQGQAVRKKNRMRSSFHLLIEHMTLDIELRITS
jgi:hypothetical protein